MALFAVVGAVVILRSFASTPPPTNATPDKAAYDTPDYYGMNIPSVMFPDARGSEGDSLMAKLQSDVAATGSGWVRTDATASLDRALFGNSENGNCGQPLCDENKLMGKKILAAIDHVTIDEISALPCGVDSSRPPLEDLAAWEKIVDCVSKRYKGKVAAYEIWNEPTVPTFYRGYQDGTAQHYYDMLKSAYTIIKRNDPVAQVVGMGGVDAFVGGQDAQARLARDKQFASDVARMGGAQYADVISTHAYSWDSCNNSVWDTYRTSVAYYQKLWGKDVWVTETGQRSAQTTDPTCTQSQYIDRGYSTLIDSGVKRIFWFALYDAADGTFGVAGKPSSAHLQEFASTPKLGQLRVETSPAAAASLSVHPGSVQTGGLDQTLAAGKYTLSFRYPYTTLNGKPVKVPDEVNVELVGGHTVTVDVDITTRTAKLSVTESSDIAAGKGRILVRANPTAEVRIGLHPGFVRQWGVDWEKVSAGDYTVKLSWPNGTTTLNKVDGTSSSGTSKLPAEINVPVKGAGTTIVLVDTNKGTSATSFVPDASVGASSGLIRVETSPAVKANISVHPGFVNQWGVDWKPLAKGSYTVLTSFLPLQIGGVPVVLPAESNFDILSQKITLMKLNLATGSITTLYSWK